MTRRLFILASALSLLLCLGTAVLWVRSYWVVDFITRARGASDWSFWSVRGSLMCWSVDSAGSQAETSFKYQHEKIADDSDKKHDIRDSIHEYGQWSTDWNRPGLHLWIGNMLESTGRGGLLGLGLTMAPSRVVIISDGWLVGLAMALPSAWGVNHVTRQRRARLRLCVNCGYDLRATPDRCPECGEQVHPC